MQALRQSAGCCDILFLRTGKALLATLARGGMRSPEVRRDTLRSEYVRVSQRCWPAQETQMVRSPVVIVTESGCFADAAEAVGDSIPLVRAKRRGQHGS